MIPAHLCRCSHGPHQEVLPVVFVNIDRTLMVTFHPNGSIDVKTRGRHPLDTWGEPIEVTEEQK